MLNSYTPQFQEQKLAPCPLHILNRSLFNQMFTVSIICVNFRHEMQRHRATEGRILTDLHRFILFPLSGLVNEMVTRLLLLFFIFYLFLKSLLKVQRQLAFSHVPQFMGFEWWQKSGYMKHHHKAGHQTWPYLRSWPKKWQLSLKR